MIPLPLQLPLPSYQPQSAHDLIDEDLAGVCYNLYTSQINWNLATHNLKQAELAFQHAALRYPPFQSPTFHQRAELCYQVLANTYPTPGHDASTSAGLDLFTTSRKAFNYEAFLAQFNMMYPPQLQSPVFETEVNPHVVEPSLVYSPSPPPTDAPSPSSYFEKNATPVYRDDVPTPTFDASVQPLDATAYSHEATWAHHAADHEQHLTFHGEIPAVDIPVMVAPETFSNTPKSSLKSTPPSPTRSTFSTSSRASGKAKRGPIKRARSAQASKIEAKPEDFPSPVETSLPTPDSYEDSDDDSSDDGDYAPSTSTSRRRSGGGRRASEPRNKKRRVSEPKREGSVDGDKKSRQPRAMLVPTVDYLRNSQSRFFLVRPSAGSEVTEKGCTEIFLDDSLDPRSPIGRSVLYNDVYSHAAYEEDQRLQSSYTFRTEEHETWRVDFSLDSPKPTVTAVSGVSSEKRATNRLTFVHFPSESIIDCEHPVGSILWWRLQGCIGATPHRGMPGPHGEWTARFDADPKDRRPARIVEHFAVCRYRQCAGDPLGTLARSAVGSRA
ncbi:hypothetical protein T439DRAFT_323043 [Meredithblackwellia eburnea MCA 4105]